MAKLSIKNINVTYAGDFAAVKDLSLDVGSNELVMLTGVSGCGKTAVLRAVAGMDKLSGGDVLIDGLSVAKLAAKKRKVVMTAQFADLSPRMTVYKCMAADVKRLGGNVDSVVRATADKLGISDVLGRKLKEISAGQLRLALLGRVIACDADVYLLDEPFAGLNAALKDELRAVISELASGRNAAVIYATSDQNEVMAMNCRVAAMADGSICQDALASEIYANPANVNAAKVIGAPAMNIIKAKLTPRDGRMFVVAGETALRVPDLTVKKLKSDIYIGKEVYVGIRPENISDDPEFTAENFGTAMDAVVEKTVYTGSGECLRLKVAGIPEGLTACISGTNAVSGACIKVAADPAKLYLFDAATGENILF